MPMTATYTTRKERATWRFRSSTAGCDARSAQSNPFWPEPERLGGAPRGACDLPLQRPLPAGKMVIEVAGVDVECRAEFPAQGAPASEVAYSTRIGSQASPKRPDGRDTQYGPR